MKIKYHKWTCAGCGKTATTPESGTSFVPYWFNIRTMSSSSSSDQPSFDTFACSPECIAKAGKSIQARIEDYNNHVPRRKEIDATICDQCGKVVKCDLLNPLIGGRNPYEGWSSSKTREGKFDFCCKECEKNHVLKPEESVFANFKIHTSIEIHQIIKALESDNFLENLKKPLFGFGKRKFISTEEFIADAKAKKDAREKKRKKVLRRPQSES